MKLISEQVVVSVSRVDLITRFGIQSYFAVAHGVHGRKKKVRAASAHLKIPVDDFSFVFEFKLAGGKFHSATCHQRMFKKSLLLRAIVDDQVIGGERDVTQAIGGNHLVAAIHIVVYIRHEGEYLYAFVDVIPSPQLHLSIRVVGILRGQIIGGMNVGMKLRLRPTQPDEVLVKHRQDAIVVASQRTAAHIASLRGNEWRQDDEGDD